MRSLSGALVAAIGSSSQRPDLRVELLDWARHYGTLYSGGPLGRTSACLAPDGSLVQAYSASGTVYARRVVDPTQVSWGSWTTVATGGASLGVCCCFVGNNDVRLIWQNAATTQVKQAISSDNGATWGAPSVLFDAGGAASGLAADRNSGNTVLVQYAFAANTYRIKAWTNSAGWTGVDWGQGDAYLGAGLAVYNISGTTYYLVVYAVQASNGGAESVWAAFYNAGTWSTLSRVVPEDVAAGRTLHEPKVASYDGLYELSYALSDSGSSSGLGSQRVALARSLDGVHWTEPLEDAGSYQYGAVGLKHASAGYLLAAADSSARAAPYTASVSQYRDCTADVLSVKVRQSEGRPAELVVELDNSLGAYTSLGPLRPNARLRLSLGYGGAGTVYSHVCYVEEWSYERSPGLNAVLVRALDAGRWLERQSRLALVWSGETLEYLVREVCARAGLLAVVVPGTAQFAAVVPQFAVPNGEAWVHALARLGGLYGFSYAAYTLADGTDGLRVVEKASGDAVSWTYGAEVEELELVHSGDRANHVLVYGTPGVSGILGEAWDFSDVASVGQERFLQVVEPLLGAASGTALRAQLELAREQRRAVGGRLGVALHAGVELFDVLSVQDSVLATVSARVVGLEHAFEARTGRYDLLLDVEGA